MTDIRDKLVKILRLADNAATEGEARAAAAAAARLAASEGIDLATIDITEGKEDPWAGFGATILDGVTSTWRGELLSNVARGFGCRCIWNNRYGTYARRYRVFGPVDATTMVVMVYQRFEPIVERLTREHLAARRAAGEPTGKLYAGNYRRGLVDGIDRAMRAEITTGLVVLGSRTEEYMGSIVTHAQTVSAPLTSLDAYRAGYQRGAQIQTRERIA